VIEPWRRIASAKPIKKPFIACAQGKRRSATKNKRHAFVCYRLNSVKSVKSVVYPNVPRLLCTGVALHKIEPQMALIGTDFLRASPKPIKNHSFLPSNEREI
jgi:hypothetical protein